LFHAGEIQVEQGVVSVHRRLGGRPSSWRPDSGNTR
jgi:hypothetical protein